MSTYSKKYKPSVNQIPAVQTNGDITCGPVGGVGPFVRSQIQGYLEYVLPDSFPPIPIVNESTPATPSGTPVPYKSPRYYGGKYYNHGKKGKGKGKEYGN